MPFKFSVLKVNPERVDILPPYHEGCHVMLDVTRRKSHVYNIKHINGYARKCEQSRGTNKRIRRKMMWK